MTLFFRFILLSSLIVGSQVAHSQTSTNPPCCSLVERALTDAYTLKPGMKRSDVEKLFMQAGGMNFPNKTLYVYKGCRLIGLEVSYDINADAPGFKPFAPTDIIKSVSKLTIDYEPMD